MNKAHDVMRNVKAARAHIETTIALIEQTPGPDRTNYEGYSAGRSRQALIEAKKLVLEAETKLASALEPQLARKEATSA